MMKAIGGGRILDLSTKPPGLLRARIRPFRARLGIIHDPKEHRGKILTPGRNKISLLLHSREGIFSVPDWTVVMDVYAAFRQTQYTLISYGIEPDTGERAILVKILENAILLNDRVLGLKPGIRPERVRERIETLVASMVDPLEHARNLNKRAALAHLEELKTGADSKGRHNPQALAARTVAIQRNVRARLDEIASIQPRILVNQMALKRMIGEAELWLTATGDFVWKLLDRDGLMPVLHYQRRTQVIAHHEFLIANLEAIDYNPYVTVAAFTASDLRLVTDMLRDGRQNGDTLRQIRKQLTLASVALHLKSTHIRIERLIYALSFKQLGTRQLPLPKVRQDIESIIQTLAKIDDSLLRRPIADQIRRHLSIALDALRHYRETADQENVRVALKGAVQDL